VKTTTKAKEYDGRLARALMGALLLLALGVTALVAQEVPV